MHSQNSALLKELLLPLRKRPVSVHKVYFSALDLHSRQKLQPADSDASNPRADTGSNIKEPLKHVLGSFKRLCAEQSTSWFLTYTRIVFCEVFLDVPGSVSDSLLPAFRRCGSYLSSAVEQPNCELHLFVCFSFQMVSFLNTGVFPPSAPKHRARPRASTQ